MRSFSKYIGVLFALLLTLNTLSFAETNSSAPQIKNINSRFIVKGKEAIDPRTVEKIDTIGNELFVKTGISAYIYASERYSKEEFNDTKSKMAFIKSFESSFLKELKEPYVILTLSLEDKHVNLLTSDSLKNAVNKDEILDEYVVPLLASHDKNSIQSKVSASMLNGYSSMVESVADFKKVKVDAVIHGQGRTFAKIWKIFMYIIIFSGLIVYIYATFKNRKES